jgi:hypothetical protein
MFRIFNSELGDWKSFPSYKVEDGKLKDGTNEYDITNLNSDKTMLDLINAPPQNNSKEFIEFLNKNGIADKSNWHPVFTIFSKQPKPTELKMDEFTDFVIGADLYKMENMTIQDAIAKALSIDTLKTKIPNVELNTDQTVVQDSVNLSTNVDNNSNVELNQDQTNSHDFVNSILNVASSVSVPIVNPTTIPTVIPVSDTSIINSSLTEALNNALKSEKQPIDNNSKTESIEGLPEKLNDALYSNQEPNPTNENLNTSLTNALNELVDPVEQKKAGGKRNPDRERVYKLPIHKRRTDNYYNYE